MPDSTTIPFYKAYVENVNAFLSAEKEIKRSINNALKSNKYSSVTVMTKVYALLYSTFSEANFMKMILTPHGFEQSFIDSILDQSNIQNKWITCLNGAFSKFSVYHKTSEIPNKKKQLINIIHQFIIDPSILRNKIAHGQFKVATNSDGTKLNAEITDKIETLTYIDVYRWFKVNIMLTGIIEDLIESPDKAHFNTYHSKFSVLTSFIDKSKSWTIESKMKTTSMSKRRPKPRS